MAPEQRHCKWQHSSTALAAILTLAACNLVLCVAGLPQKPSAGREDVLRENRDILRSLISNSSGRLEDHIRELSRTSSLAGSKASMRHVEYVETYWRNLGFRVVRRSYEVPMSYFDEEDKNATSSEEAGAEESSREVGQPSVSVCSEVKGQCRRLELDKPFTQEDGDIEGLSRAFYSLSRPLSGHFGLLKLEDLALFTSVDNLSSILHGNLVLIWPNETASMELIMRLAATNVTNNTGFMLVYTPPSEEENERAGGTETTQSQQPVYPNGPGSPDTAVTFHLGGPEDTVGDPTTPGYPSRWYASRREPGGTGGWKSVLNVTVVPISVADAVLLTDAFFSDNATESRPYLQVHWPLKFGYRKVHDSCAELPGVREPDRVVLIGSHRDAWFGGAVDPHTGMATLLETSLSLAELIRTTGWKPRRTILMCAWDAEEIGLMGSVEWVEEEYMRAGSRLVAYFNTDTDVMGDWKMLVQASDQLTSIIDQVMSEAPDAVDADGSRRHFFYKLDDSSDYFSFTRALGVPACDISYIRGHRETLTLYDLYHTQYETPHLYRMLDPSGEAHLRLTQSVAALVYTMADSLLLPLNMSAFAEGLRRRLYDGFFEAADDVNGERGSERERSELDNVSQRLQVVALSALENATRALQTFEASKKFLSLDELRLRMVNDKMMLVQKAFTHHCVFPCDGASINLLNSIPSNIPAEKVAQAIIFGLNSVAKILTDSFVDDD